MRIQRPFPVLLLAFFSINVAFGQTSSSDPAEVFQRLLFAGLENDPRGKAIALAYGAAVADARETEAKRLFDAGVGGSYSYSLPDSGYDGDLDPSDAAGLASAEATASTLGPLGSTIGAGLSYDLRHDDEDYSDDLGAKLSFTLPVFANGRLVDPRIGPAARRIAVGSPLEAATESEKNERCAFVASVMDMILEFSSARSEARLSEGEASIAQRDLVIARVKYSSGVLPFKDLQESENAAEAAELSSISARAAYANLARKLSASTGIPVAELEALPIAFPLPPPSFRPSAPVQECLSVSRAERALRDAEAARIVSGAQSAPKLGLSGGYSWELGNTFPGPESEKAKGPLSLGASLSVDLGFAAASRRREAADARAKAAARSLDEAKTLAASGVGDVEAKIESAMAQADFLSSSAVAAKARLAELQASVKAGTALALDAERASLAYERASAKLEGKRVEHLMALVELYRLAGKDGTVLLSDIAAAKAR